MHLEWSKRADGEWFELDEVDLTKLRGVAGVYVIWVGSAIPSRPGRILKVGSGNLPTRLAYERIDPLLYLVKRPPLVTWAEVEDRHHPGLVFYLTQSLQPALLDRKLPECEPLPVNPPISA